MVDTKKEQERDELHRAIWAIADELRGAVDGWDFKNYVLGTMFYRYISENLCSYVNEGEAAAGNTDFDYAQMSDEDAEVAREGLVEEKGFFILPSELFVNVCKKAPNDENLNETLETVFRHIEDSAKGSQSESDFAGLFDDFDVNSNKLGATVAKRNEKLVKLLNGIADMNLGNVQDHDIDAFGDAYEYLMSMYASNAGKSVETEKPEDKTAIKWYRVRKNWTDSKTQKGAYKILDNAKKCANQNPGYKVFDADGKVVYEPKAAEPAVKVSFLVKVSISDLNIRSGAGTNFARVQFCPTGVYTIMEVKAGQGSKAGWGRLKSGIGWLSLDFCQRV